MSDCMSVSMLHYVVFTHYQQYLQYCCMSRGEILCVLETTTICPSLCPLRVFSASPLVAKLNSLDEWSCRVLKYNPLAHGFSLIAVWSINCHNSIGSIGELNAPYLVSRPTLHKVYVGPVPPTSVNDIWRFSISDCRLWIWSESDWLRVVS